MVLCIVLFQAFITPSNSLFCSLFSFFFFWITKWHENLLDTTRWTQPENYRSNERLYAIFWISSLPCASWVAHQLIINVLIQGYNARFEVDQKWAWRTNIVLRIFHDLRYTFLLSFLKTRVDPSFGFNVTSWHSLLNSKSLQLWYVFIFFNLFVITCSCFFLKNHPKTSIFLLQSIAWNIFFFPYFDFITNLVSLWSVESFLPSLT